MTLKEILDRSSGDMDEYNDLDEMFMLMDVVELIQLLWDRTDFTVEKTVNLYYDKFEGNFNCEVPDDVRSDTVEEIKEDFNVSDD